MNMVTTVHRVSWTKVSHIHASTADPHPRSVWWTTPSPRFMAQDTEARLLSDRLGCGTGQRSGQETQLVLGEAVWHGPINPGR